MRRTTPVLVSALAVLSVLLPTVVGALDYADATSRYADAPFGRAEAAGISLLTRLGAVEGNPDGTFHPERTLNRAEFVKIALLTADPEFSAEPQNCFPDVHAVDWFSRFVCAAQKSGVVQGNPDGLFHPERPVNYAEAVKILTVLYGHDLAPVQGEEWYKQYFRAAEGRKILLPIALSYDRALTRGQMARLAAAYAAEAAGELDAYRAAEQGRTVRSSSKGVSSSSAPSSVSSSVQSSSAVSSSAVSSSAPQSSSVKTAVRARNRILLLGTETPLVADGTFVSLEEDADVRNALVTVRTQVRSIDQMFLTDALGNHLLELKLDTSDSTRTRWRGESATPVARMTKAAPQVFGVVFTLRTRGNDGISGELVEFERFTLDTVTTSGLGRELGRSEQTYPVHQTAQAALKTVVPTLPSAGTMPQGTRREVAAFRFSGSLLGGTSVLLQELELRVERTGVTTTRWRIGTSSEVQQADCAQDSADITLVSCTLVPEAVREIGTAGGTLSVFADVAVEAGAQNPSLRVSLEDTGAIGRRGSVIWSDATTRFSWFDSLVSFPVRGPLWTVAK